MKVGGLFLELLALCLDLTCTFYFNFAINIPCLINAFVAFHTMLIFHNQAIVATLALGSCPKQGLARVWAKSHTSCSWECRSQNGSLITDH
jgi:hypothetical protein